MLDLEAIKNILPHRYPFLLIDRVLELETGKYCKALKNITANESLFQGHFPQQAVFPGVMMVEAMAQTAGIVIHSSKKKGDTDLEISYGREYVKNVIFYSCDSPKTPHWAQPPLFCPPFFYF